MDTDIKRTVYPVNPKYVEFQAIVLAGGTGSRLSELKTTQPKCLLPVANFPMIWYPLHTLERAGFKEAIVIVSELTKSLISLAVEKLNLKIKIDFVGIADAEDIGTADAIRRIHEKIYTDIVVISCDLITNIDLLDVLNTYRMHDASITALIFPMPKTFSDFTAAGPKDKKQDTDLIGIDNETKRLIFLASTWDYKTNIEFSSKMFEIYSSFTIYTKLIDAHLYIINKWVVDFMISEKSFSSLKSELIPYVVRKQLFRPKHNSKKDCPPTIFKFTKNKLCQESINEILSVTDQDSDQEEANAIKNAIQCYAYVSNENFGLRVNTVQMYHFANAKILALWNIDNDDRLSPLPGISNKATVHSRQVQDCRIDQQTVIEEATSIKQSHIGPNCKVASKTRISDSIIMENVEIKGRCIINNCILCKDCVISEDVELKDCIVGPRHVVKAGSKHFRDILIDVDTFLEY